MNAGFCLLFFFSAFINITNTLDLSNNCFIGNNCVDLQCLVENFQQSKIERTYLLFSAARINKLPSKHIEESFRNREVEKKEEHHDVVEFFLETHLNFTKMEKNAKTLKKIELPLQNSKEKKYSLLWVRVPLAKAEKYDLPISLFGYALAKDSKHNSKYPNSSRGILWINRFPNSANEINRKDKIALHMQLHSRLFNYTSIHPFSFIISQPDSLSLLKNQLIEDDHLNLQKWIIKPIYGGQGLGIIIANSSYLMQWITERETEKVENKTIEKANFTQDANALRSFIVQKYIESPFLIDGLKHTLRLYVLITSLDPLRFYLHRNGIIKFASEEFKVSLDFHSNDFSHMHITHPLDLSFEEEPINQNFTENSNRKCNISRSVPFERRTPDGKPFRWNTLAYTNYLNKEMPNGIKVNTTKLWIDVKDALVKMVLSFQNSLRNCNKNRNFSCFQLLGVDIELAVPKVNNNEEMRCSDQECTSNSFTDLSIYVLEANVNPSLNFRVPEEQQEKLEMIEDMFNMLGLSQFDKYAFLGSLQSRISNTIKEKKESLNDQLTTKYKLLFNDSLSEDSLFQIASFEYEDLFAGGFETLYPNSGTVNTYFQMFLTNNETKEGSSDELLKEWVLFQKEVNKQ